MLLIQSDMAKALWLIISPLFYFITGRKPFHSNWVFCQVSGFFLTATIVASDIAVLLIAIHTVLFIVKRQHPGAPVGLQPYRRIAYAVWAIVPLTLAAVVPITGGRFVDNGPHCYLPVQPAWYRSALSWFPRYAIFGFILVTYTWLYLYVYFRFRQFGEYQRTATNTSSHPPTPPSQRSRRIFQNRSVPPTPPIATHGLLDSAFGATPRNDTSKFRQHSGTSTASTLGFGEPDGILVPPEHVVRKSSISWNLVDFERDGSTSPRCVTPGYDTAPVSPRTSWPPLSRSNTHDNAPPIILSAPEPAHARTHNSAAADSDTSQLGSLPDIRYSVWRRRLNTLEKKSGSRNDSLPNFVAALRQRPPTTEGSDDTGQGGDIHSSASSVRLPSEVSEEVMRRSRDRMQRQMRWLFVYPAIYVVTWIAPFVEHLYSYDSIYSWSHPAANVGTSTTLGLAYHNLANSTTSFIPAPTFAQPTEPFTLRIISMASLCIGAAVDCSFFTTWERPWKHLRVGFWEGLAARLRVNRILCGLSRDEGNQGWGPGRDRDERVAEQRVAWRRREREREMAFAALRSETSSTVPESRNEGGASRTSNGSRRARREWWDALDMDEDL
jgi:G protein-coupled receptor GPR1